MKGIFRVGGRVSKSRLGVAAAAVIAVGLASAAAVGASLPPVASGLAEWQKADALTLADGTRVATWADSSVNGRNGTQATAQNQPLFKTGIQNGMPVVRFDGPPNSNPSNIDESLAVGSGASNPINGLGSYTVFAASKLVDPGGYDGLMPVWDSTDRFALMGQGTVWRFRDTPSTFLSISAGSTWKNNFANLAVVVDASATNKATSYSNGTLVASTTTALLVPTGGIFYIGRFDTNRFNGDIGEVLVYNRALNSAERRVTENYLSSKYAVAMTTGSDDKYAGDTPGNGAYYRDVIGIGAESDGSLLSSSGAGLTITAASLDPGDYLMAGHKMVTNSVTQADLPVSPAGMAGRWSRVWYLDKTQNLDATLSFDFSDSGLPAPSGGWTSYNLLYSATNAYSFTALGLSPTVVGDQVSFTLLDGSLADGYYTLGIIPEPASLLLLALGGLFLHRGRGSRRIAN